MNVLAPPAAADDRQLFLLLPLFDSPEPDSDPSLSNTSELLSLKKSSSRSLLIYLNSFDSNYVVVVLPIVDTG